MFKYYTIPSVDILEKILGEKATIKFSSAFNLNDSFELKFNLEIEPEYEGHEKAFYDRNPGSTKEDFESWKNHALNHHGYTWYAEQTIRDSLAQTISLCSFSKNNTSNLMWSHYTDNYKGICIEYNDVLFDYLHSLKNHIASDIITYSETPPILKGSDPVNVIAKKLMFNKQIEWQYEQEFRVIIRSDENTEFIPIDRSLIKAVYIGSRVDREIEQKILSLANQASIEVYIGITLGDSYKVQFKKPRNNTIYSRSFWG